MWARLNRLLPSRGLARILVPEAPEPGELDHWVEGGWSGVCLGLGPAAWLQGRRGPKPALLVYLDGPSELHRFHARPCVDPEVAVALDAVAGVIRFPTIALRPEVSEAAARTLARAASRAYAWGLPVLAEVSVLRPVGATRYEADPDPAHLWEAACRALDLGAAGLLLPRPSPDGCRGVVAAAAWRPVFVELGEEEAERVGASGVLVRQEAHKQLRSPSWSGYGVQ